MTTIVIDQANGMLYADRQETWDNNVKIQSTKLRMFNFKGSNNTCFIACAGTSTEEIVAIKLIKSARSVEDILNLKEKPKLKNFECLIVDDDKNCYFVNEKFVPLLIEDDYFAIGAGWALAIALVKSNMDIRDVYKTIHKTTTHTSQDFNFVMYNDPEQDNYEIQYEPNPD